MPGARWRTVGSLLGSMSEQVAIPPSSALVITVVPSGANFLLVRVHGDAHELCVRVQKQSVMVRDFATRPGVEGCFRVTVGTPTENDEFLAALRAALPEVLA